MHEIKSIRGAFIQFACAANEGVRNNLFTKHLLKYITRENINISELFRWIAENVQRESNSKQRPLSINGLRHHQDVYLNEVIPPVQSKSRRVYIKFLKQRANIAINNLAFRNGSIYEGLEFFIEKTPLQTIFH